METFQVPTREEVNTDNQAIFDQLKNQLGFVPNLYATYAYSDTALGNYLNFQGAKTSLNNREKEVINLVVSEVNQCLYCLSAHTAIAKLNGFTESQILELRAGYASFDTKLDALVKLAKELTANRGRAGDSILDRFFEAGYNKGNLIDVILVVGDKTISNYINNTTEIPIDFPVAQKLHATAVI